jgi:cell division septum initiation protein DivIVA
MIGGSQGLDQTMNYAVGITIPRSELGSSANAIVDNLISKATSAGLKVDPLENLTIHAKVTGTFKDPKVGLDMKENSQKSKEEIKAQVMETVKVEIDKKKEEARAAAQAEADKIMAEAQKQADALRKNAEDAANVVRQEANTNADNMVKKATNPISKKLAEEGAKQVKKEAEASAQKIIQEADTKAQAILKAAKDQGDKLLGN